MVYIRLLFSSFLFGKTLCLVSVPFIEIIGYKYIPMGVYEIYICIKIDKTFSISESVNVVEPNGNEGRGINWEWSN